MLRWKTDGQGAQMVITFEGDVTEQASLDSLVPMIAGPTVTFDVSDVTRFNSMGVKAWLRFVDELNERDIRITLDRCSVAFVQQINMISGFEGTGGCRSVYVPYYCEACNREDRILLDMGADLLTRIPNAIECKKCKGQMEFDDLREHYERLVKLFA